MEGVWLLSGTSSNILCKTVIYGADRVEIKTQRKKYSLKMGKYIMMNLNITVRPCIEVHDPSLIREILYL
jgi:hypothetical protein